jgi:hypothetical protein
VERNARRELRQSLYLVEVQECPLACTDLCMQLLGVVTRCSGWEMHFESTGAAKALKRGAASKWIPNNMALRPGRELPNSSENIIRSPDLPLPSLTEELAQPPLIYEADVFRPNDYAPFPSLDGRARKLNVFTPSTDPYRHGAEEERPNLHRDDGRIRQLKVYYTLSYDPCRHSSAKMN